MASRFPIDLPAAILLIARDKTLLRARAATVSHRREESQQRIRLRVTRHSSLGSSAAITMLAVGAEIAIVVFALLHAVAPVSGNRSK